MPATHHSHDLVVCCIAFFYFWWRWMNRDFAIFDFAPKGKQEQQCACVVC